MAMPKLLFACGASLIALIVFLKVFSTTYEIGGSSDYFTSSLDALRVTVSGTSIKKRLQKSEQLWRESVGKRHELYESDADPNNDMFPAIDQPTYFASPFTIWDFFPATYGCPHEMERLGRLGDGGKWICGMSRYEATSPKRQCVVYSFGIQNETSFEQEILQRTQCELFGYDFSVDGFPEQFQSLPRDQMARAHFLKAGIGGTSNPQAAPPLYSIGDLMKQNGHDYIDIIKMDIEGSEYEAMASFMDNFAGVALPVGQFMVEIHLMPGLQDFPGFLNWWERLEKAGMRPVWTEPNLLQVTLSLHDTMPRYAEYTMINAQHPSNVLLSG